MHRRAWPLFVLAALAFVAAYWFYYEEAESTFFTGASGQLVLIASVFLTGALVAWAGGGRHGRGGHGHHGHDPHEHGGHEHGHGHEEPRHGRMVARGGEGDGPGRQG